MGAVEEEEEETTAWGMVGNYATFRETEQGVVFSL